MKKGKIISALLFVFCLEILAGCQHIRDDDFWHPESDTLPVHSHGGYGGGGGH